MSSLERLDPEHFASTDAFAQESARFHLERYQFAASHVSGKTVLDLACGIGYGSAILSDAGAAAVFGVDLDSGAIETARNQYARPNVTFLAAPYQTLRQSTDNRAAAALPDRFDVIVSLETIEHLPDPDEFLDVLRSKLAPGGLLVASVPVTPSVDANPYHLHDFTPRSFRRLLARHGLIEVTSKRQRQTFNPLRVRKQLSGAGRTEFRQDLMGYYVAHPYAAYKRAASTLRYGFVNLVDIVVARAG